MHRAFVLAGVLLVGFASADTLEPEQLRGMFWAWGNPEMEQPGAHTTASFAQAGPMERAQILGVPNVIMAGYGIPDSDEAAAKGMASISSAKRVVWEIAPSKKGEPGTFDFTDAVARVKHLAEKHPNIEGVLLDDMSTMSIRAGLKPAHIRAIRDQLGPDNQRIRIWGVLYTMNLHDPEIGAYVNELDIITLPEWYARDLPKLEENVAYCASQWPDKPIVLALYLHDYGEGRSIPSDLLRQQNETALALAHDKRIAGIVYVTIDNEPEAVSRTAQWIREQTGQASYERLVRLGDGQSWSFSGDAWTEDSDGVIRPPDARNLHSRAFYTAERFGDAAIEFEYNANYREVGTGNAGVILRASDPNHFYYVHFPWGGQQLRAKHFWAGLAKVEGDAYQRNMAFEYVPGVPSEVDRWYHVRVETNGARIRVWVDGRAALDAKDDMYAGGCMGLAGYGWYAFRNIRVAGTALPASEWKPAPVPTHNFTVGFDSQVMPSGCVAPNGDILLAQANKLVRSKDKGRTWGAVETLPASLGEVGDYGCAMFRAGDTLRVMVYRKQDEVKKPVPEIAIATSHDNGATWNEPIASTVAPEWPALPKSLTPYGPVHVTQDGAWLRFLLGGVKQDSDVFTDVRSWGATHCKAYVIRSTDQGASWSAPIDIDWPSWNATPRGTIPGSLDFTEPSAAVMGNTVTVLIRPVYSETMWQCWSNDGGATWDAASRATFPGYAQSVARTQSGAIVCAHRYPQYSVNVSRDGGLNWDAGTVIDYPAWAMGCMVEVEPDVLLCTYMNCDRDKPLLAQLVRVTPDRVEPVTR